MQLRDGQHRWPHLPGQWSRSPALSPNEGCHQGTVGPQALVPKHQGQASLQLELGASRATWRR